MRLTRGCLTAAALLTIMALGCGSDDDATADEQRSAAAKYLRAGLESNPAICDLVSQDERRRIVERFESKDREAAGCEEAFEKAGRRDLFTAEEIEEFAERIDEAQIESIETGVILVPPEGLEGQVSAIRLVEEQGSWVVDGLSPSSPSGQGRVGYQAEILAVASEAETEIRASSLFTDLVTPGESAAECAELMDEFRTGLSTIADRIDSIEPPDEVADAHDELAETFREGADELADDETQIEAGELKCGRKLNNRIYGSPLREQGERAIEEIEAAGFVVLGR